MQPGDRTATFPVHAVEQMIGSVSISRSTRPAHDG
jgi:hypothetical protein